METFGGFFSGGGGGGGGVYGVLFCFKSELKHFSSGNLIFEVFVFECYPHYLYCSLLLPYWITLSHFCLFLFLPRNFRRTSKKTLDLFHH